MRQKRFTPQSYKKKSAIGCQQSAVSYQLLTPFLTSNLTSIVTSFLTPIVILEL